MGLMKTLGESKSRISGRERNLANIVDLYDEKEKSVSSGREGFFRESIEGELLNTIRQMILDNFQSSNIKSRTGKLESALKGVTARVNWRAKRPKILIEMPRNVTPYKSEGSQSNFYKVFSSLEWGSVRGTGGDRKTTAVKKKNRKIKKKLRRASKNGFAVIDGQTFDNVAKGGSGNVTSGGVVVTKEFKFWRLKPKQKAIIRQMYNERFRSTFGDI